MRGICDIKWVAKIYRPPFCKMGCARVRTGAGRGARAHTRFSGTLAFLCQDLQTHANFRIPPYSIPYLPLARGESRSCLEQIHWSFSRFGFRNSDSRAVIVSTVPRMNAVTSRCLSPHFMWSPSRTIANRRVRVSCLVSRVVCGRVV